MGIVGASYTERLLERILKAIEQQNGLLGRIAGNTGTTTSTTTA